MNQAQQPEALRLADAMDQIEAGITANSIMADASDELRRLHARVQKLEAERETNDWVLRSSVPDRWKGCTSPIGSVQSYIAELEGFIEMDHLDVEEAIAARKVEAAAQGRTT